MTSSHFFCVENREAFLGKLTAKTVPWEKVFEGPEKREEPDGTWVYFSKTISGAVLKAYSYDTDVPETIRPFPIRVRISLVNEGRSLKALAHELERLKKRHLDAIPALWKTKKRKRARSRSDAQSAIRKWMRQHAELIACFMMRQADSTSEWPDSFNLRIPSTPRERAICNRFLMALVDATAVWGGVDRSKSADVGRNKLRRKTILARRKKMKRLRKACDTLRPLRERGREEQLSTFGGLDDLDRQFLGNQHFIFDKREFEKYVNRRIR